MDKELRGGEIWHSTDVFSRENKWNNIKKMYTNKHYVKFNFGHKNLRLFNDKQKEDWSIIEKEYEKLKKRCVKEIFVPTEATHKEWIAARVNLHRNESIMRLLYLTEAFCEVSKKFNGPAAAVLIKGMVEIPLHLGYLSWLLSEHRPFEKMRKELSKIAFGNRDESTGLTSSSKVSGKDMYEKADKIMQKTFQENELTKVFETLYKDANATGHHNFEGRMLCGIKNDNTWKTKDRKELFTFYTKSIFPFFFKCEAILVMTSILYKTIDHYLKHLPDYLDKKK